MTVWRGSPACSAARPRTPGRGRRIGAVRGCGQERWPQLRLRGGDEVDVDGAGRSMEDGKLGTGARRGHEEEARCSGVTACSGDVMAHQWSEGDR